jgi:exopolyphosphatase/guanosine-5'-triphosphate,3'-diphosphate pyrophosphatase
LRIAAIDVGTNSIHMVIARVTAGAGLEVVDRERDVVQIGRGSWGSGRLSARAMRRTVEALGRYVQLARRHQVDHILCTATAAVREARNGGAFVQAAREATGILPHVIPAEEEGRLIWLGVRSALELPAEPSLIVDIGGGSVQLVVGNRDRLRLAAACPLGALRLTEERLADDPPSRRELQRLRRHVRRQSRDALAAVRDLRPRHVYGSSGSIHALAEAAHWLETGRPLARINGSTLDRGALERLTRRLETMSVAERLRIPGIDARRAEIIVPGAIVLLHVLEAVDADGMLLSDAGVREGLVMDYIASHPRELSSLERVEGLRQRSVLGLLGRFPVNEKHAQHVARLALALFDGLQVEHRLDAGARELLHHAALLHDVGAALGYDGHGEHSHYIIRNGNLRGFSTGEVEMIASVARFHGQRRPRKKVLRSLGLDKPQRRSVRWLAAILRIAEGLDRSHYQLARGLRVRRRNGAVSIVVRTRRDARLELWAARRRTQLLEKLLGKRVWLRPETAKEAVRPAIARRRAAAPPTRRRAPAAAASSPAPAQLRGVATVPAAATLAPRGGRPN